ncbi:hypothetical protein AgCh_011870 [Apium graveolens]
MKEEDEDSNGIFKKNPENGENYGRRKGRKSPCSGKDGEKIFATPTNTPKSSAGTMTPVGGSPYMATPSNGVLGDVNSLGPSGVGINTDDSAAGQQSTSRIITGIMFLGNLLVWGMIDWAREARV